MSTTQEIHALIRRAFAIESNLRIKGSDELAVHCHGEGARIILAEDLRMTYGIDVVSADIKKCQTVNDVEIMVIRKEAETQRTGFGNRPGIGSFASYMLSAESYRR